MSGQPTRTAGDGRTAAWVVGMLGTLLLMGVLAWILVRSTRPEDLTAARAVERYKFLQEVRQSEATILTSYAWQDQAKGFVRIPVHRAMELVAQEWQEPARARSNLIARVEKAAEPPPKPPEKPSVYE